MEVLGCLWRPLGPLERPGQFRTSFYLSFSYFSSALGAQAAPKGAPRSAKATKMMPKVIQKASKSGDFFEISKTLNLNGSTVIFMVFWCPGGFPGRPKNNENHCTIIKIQGFANFKKILFRGRFWLPSVPLWAPFWSPLRSLGLLLALPGPPQHF